MTSDLAKGGMIIGLICQTSQLETAQSLWEQNGAEIEDASNGMIIPHTEPNGIFLQFVA